MSRWWWCLCLGSLACRPSPSALPVSSEASPAPASPCAEVSTRAEGSPPGAPRATAAVGVGVEPLPGCAAQGLDALSAARRYSDQERFAEALACAAQAAAQDPDDPVAHSERGAALVALGRFEPAQLAYARALALDPDQLDALHGAAHLFGERLPSTRERQELAAVYAERGLAVALEEGEKEVALEFALFSAMVLNDLGSATHALARAEQVLAVHPEHPEAAYERALALFESSRFSEARAAFTSLLEDPERAAYAHHRLGLLLERESAWAEAEAHFAQARRLAPGEFFAPHVLPAETFRAEVKRAIQALPADMQRDLRGIPVEVEELPRDEDLRSADPPLSPAILGLFRGPPLDQPCEGEKPPCRSVALYRKNLQRVVTGRAELLEQIRVTLLHEVGHLRGEDDLELAARGLE